MPHGPGGDDSVQDLTAAYTLDSIMTVSLRLVGGSGVLALLQSVLAALPGANGVGRTGG